MKVKDPDVTPIGPWHAARTGLFPKRTYDGRWVWNVIIARRRVVLNDPKFCPSSRERWQFADLDQVLSTAP